MMSNNSDLKASCDYPENILREWAPLTDLFNKLPVRVLTGLFPQDVNLTCLDVLPEFLALGTNLGIIYWYDRKKKDLQRLRCEKQNVPITTVKIISTVDYMVACGTEDGTINIFQIPKSYPDSIPENLKPKNKQVERYTVTLLHKSSITAIEWSKNGMKLFSGDKNGLIVLTEIDFYMHICKSVEILNEAYEVVQLSYCQQKLLVSTTYRSVICQYQNNKWNVGQVGKKDRKILGHFGGLVIQNGQKTTDIQLYCSRPGLRIWTADSEGNVVQTLLFKDLLCKECTEVPIINPISKNLKSVKPQKEPSFGILLPFNENLILTYSNDVIYILDPQKMAVISTMSHFRNVLWVATYKDEIFVLEESRSVIRISYKPESVYDVNSSTPTGSAFLPITTSIKDLTNKLQNTSIITQLIENVDEVNVHTDGSMVMSAEEAQESPVRKMAVQNPQNDEKFDDIGKQQFSDTILFKHNKPKKKKTPSIKSASTSSLSSNSSEEKSEYVNHFTNKSTLMNLSAVGILPDLRSPESIQSDIEYKEKILADVLSFDTVKIPLERLQRVANPENKKDREDPRTSITSNTSTQKPSQSGALISAQNSTKTYSSTFSNTSPLDNTKKNPTSQCSTAKDPANTSVIGAHPNMTPVLPLTNSTPPALYSVPNHWKLGDIRINAQEGSNPIDKSGADTSLTDWEIV